MECINGRARRGGGEGISGDLSFERGRVTAPSQTQSMVGTKDGWGGDSGSSRSAALYAVAQIRKLLAARGPQTVSNELSLGSSFGTLVTEGLSSS